MNCASFRLIAKRSEVNHCDLELLLTLVCKLRHFSQTGVAQTSYHRNENIFAVQLIVRPYSEYSYGYGCR